MTYIDTGRISAALTGYELGAELGRGGFGAVLAGRHRLIDRDVAVKVLLEPAEGDGDLRSRFLSEARVLAGLDHPHVVRIYDYVEHDGLCLLVMEQLTGGSLKNRAAGMRDPRAGCAVGLAAAAALAAAHDRGVLHRDIKPDNLLFTGDGIPKITDFGIAKILETTAATTTGLVGTPRYMAPEQITGARLGPGTDLYSLGVVLYELLSGRTPFPTGLTVPALLHHHLSVAPQPLAEVPPPLAAIILAALAKEPEWRPRTAHDFALALAAAATAAFGPGWLAASGVPVRLDDDILTAAGHTSGTTPTPAELAGQLGAGASGAWPPAPPGTRPGLATTRVDPTGPRRRRGHRPPAGPEDRPRRRTVLLASLTAAAVLAVALGLGIWFATGDSDPERPAYAGTPVEVAGLYSLQDVDIGQDGSLYVVDGGRSSAAQGQVLRLRTDGTLARIGGVGPPAPTPSPSSTGDGVSLTSSETPSPSGEPTRSPSPSPTPVLGDGGPAGQANLINPVALAVGPRGDVYVADNGDARVRRIDDDRITTVAGAGPSKGFSGTEGKATGAALTYPRAVAVSDSGDLYIAEGYRIRKVTPDGHISVVAGSASTSGQDGDGGPAEKATFVKPAGIAVADDGTLYIADTSAHTVRRIMPDGKITLFAGTPGQSGYEGDGGLAVNAQLYYPQDLALGPNGELYIADTSNDVIRKVTPDGKITTFAGTSDYSANNEDGAQATQTRLSSPTGLAVDVSGSVYVSEGDEGALLRIGPDGIVTTVLRTADD